MQISLPRHGWEFLDCVSSGPLRIEGARPRAASSSSPSLPWSFLLMTWSCWMGDRRSYAWAQSGTLGIHVLSKKCLLQQARTTREHLDIRAASFPLPSLSSILLSCPDFQKRGKEKGWVLRCLDGREVTLTSNMAPEMLISEASLVISLSLSSPSLSLSLSLSLYLSVSLSLSLFFSLSAGGGGSAEVLPIYSDNLDACEVESEVAINELKMGNWFTNLRWLAKGIHEVAPNGANVAGVNCREWAAADLIGSYGTAWWAI